MYDYRLTIVDKDGGIKYSKVFSISNSSIKKITLSPHPATQQITISLTENATNASIFINNNEGKTMANISNQADGLYFIPAC